MAEQTTTTLGELAADTASAFATGPFGSAVSARNFKSSGVPMLRGSNLSDDVGVRLNDSDAVFVSEALADEFSRSIVRPGDLVFTSWGTVGQVGIIESNCRFGRYLVSNKQMKMTPDCRRVSPLFLYYYLSQRSMVELVRGHAIGSSVPGFNLGQLKALRISIPNLSTQNAIAQVLGALDDKIGINERILGHLGELADATFALSAEEGSDLVSLESLATFHNRQRIPLSSREREARKGAVPYYGAAGPLDRVDEALFNEPLVLVGEDGSVIRDDGTPVVQYIWGPSWVNNHAHVLTGNGISTEMLRVAVGRANVMHLVTGAVQPKISMGNLKKLQLRMPTRLAGIEAEVQRLAALARAMAGESTAIAQTRDELLPLLMSGKVRVRDAEKVVEGVA